MRNLDKVAALLATVALPSVAVADNHSHSGHDMHSGHHQATNTMEPAAEAGKLCVYHWPCADRESGLAILKSMIAYERTASPYPYSAAQPYTKMELWFQWMSILQRINGTGGCMAKY